eukprot:GEMP01037022.1.p1 GENE.GEMP01037022.1~~GEMP01037022.1.p1  ORF type:complete len:526 (+),score=103.36 GEMP01037022.1:33-1610(+)
MRRTLRRLTLAPAVVTPTPSFVPQFEDSLHMHSEFHAPSSSSHAPAAVHDALAKLDEALRQIAPLTEKDVVYAMLCAQAPEETYIASYGSIESSTYASGSDLDFTLLSNAEDGKPELRILLKHLRLRSLLRDHGVSVRKTIIIGAKIRLLRFQADVNGFPIECDVTHNNWSGIKNTCFIKEIAKSVPHFAPMSRLVKFWARSNKIGDRSSNGLATYALSLLVMRYLQMHNMFLPLDVIREFCQDLSRVATVVAPPDLPTLPPIDIAEREPIGRLWPGFFDFMTSLQSGGCVDVLTGRTTKVEHSTLVVLCPITQLDVNPLKPQQWAAIHDQFVKITKKLREEKICEAVLAATEDVNQLKDKLEGARASKGNGEETAAVDITKPKKRQQTKSNAEKQQPASTTKKKTAAETRTTTTTTTKGPTHVKVAAAASDALANCIETNNHDDANNSCINASGTEPTLSTLPPVKRIKPKGVRKKATETTGQAEVRAHNMAPMCLAAEDGGSASTRSGTSSINEHTGAYGDDL